MRKLLQDNDDWFTDDALKALDDIFATFDKDKDGCLSVDELIEFSHATNGVKFDKATIQEIQDSFDIRDADGALTKKGFLEMYHLQTLSEPSETRKDLKKHGFKDFL